MWMQKKATGEPGEHALVHEDVSLAYAMLPRQWSFSRALYNSDAWFGHDGF